MTRNRKIRLISIGGLAVYFFIVYFGISALLTRMVPDKLAAQLGRTVSIENIRVNPFTLSVTVRGLDIRDRNGGDRFVRFDRLYVNAEILSLFKRGLVLKALQLEKPEITVSRLSDTVFSFSDLITGTSGDKPDGSTEPFRFAVADISIIDGAVVYRDLPTGESHTMTPINMRLPLISNFETHRDRFSEPALACTVDGADLTVDVQTKPFKDTLETVVALSLSGLSLPHYTAYLPKDRIHFQVRQGILDISARISFRKEEGGSVVEAQGNMALADLHVADNAGGDIVRLPKLTLTVLPSVVTENHMHLGEIRVESPTLSAVRTADGTLNLAGLTTGSEAQSPESAPAATDKNVTPFALDVDRFVLDGGTVRFTDFAAVPSGSSPDTGPVETTIGAVNVTVAPFSTAPDAPSSFDLSAKINDSALLGITGQMTVTPFSVTSDITLSDLLLAWGQPYLPEYVNLVVTGGTASTSAHLSLSMADDGPLSAKITGKAAVREFASVDPEKAESFLRWDEFSLDGVNVSVEPLRVSVDKIAVSNLKNRLVVYEDGTSSLKKIFTTSNDPPVAPDAPDTPTETEAVTPIRIGTFVMTNTEFRFMDRSLNPHYTTRLTMKNLNVTGLTSEDFKAADVKATGTIDGYAPLTVTGTVNPLGRDLFVDLDVSLANMEMTPFSAYTGKFIGRAIEKGKLNVDVKYHIKEKAITAGNHLLLDQFTLGKTVDSPDAMNLPVGLAVSLLTDRNGEIDIDLPVSGRTDDPEFAWGKVVLKTLGNLIMKAATSPFALVGSLVGGGEELRFIEFEPGTADIDEAGGQKLDAIRTLLSERPALNMEIVGYADPDADRRALAELALDRLIKAPALMDAAKNGKSPDAKTLSAIVLTPEQRERTLRKLYKKQVLATATDDPSTKKLNDPTLTPGDMETALIDRMTVTDADLQLLAAERAGQVKEYLLVDQAVAADRVFLKEADTPLKTAADEFKPSRVELGVQ